MGINVFPAPSSAKTQYTKIINSTQSWTAPAGVTSIDVLLVGAGGGGGSGSTTGYSGGGGGGGGVVLQSLAVSAGTSYTVTVGAGGSFGSSGNAGANGNATSFGSLLTSYGGGGGRGTSGAPAGSVAVASGGGMAMTSGVGGAGGGAGYQFTPVSSGGSAELNFAGVKQGTFGINTNNLGTGQDRNGNPGINGYGAGGGGATGGSSLRYSWGGLNAGDGCKSDADATAATANCGGGGGGGAIQGGVRAATAGGSGVCIIKYWA